MGWGWIKGYRLHGYETCLSHWTQADPGQERCRAAGEWIATMWSSSADFFSLCCCLHLSMCPPSYWNESWTNTGKPWQSRRQSGRSGFVSDRRHNICLCKDKTNPKKGIFPIVSQISKQLIISDLTLPFIMSNILLSTCSQVLKQLTLQF